MRRLVRYLKLLYLRIMSTHFMLVMLSVFFLVYFVVRYGGLAGAERKVNEMLRNLEKEDVKHG